MLFGLLNASTTFQVYINQALTRLIDVICIIYLDDIFIFLKDPAKYITAIWQIFERLSKYNLYVKLLKCVFNINIVEFLEFVVELLEIKTDSFYIETI